MKREFVVAIRNDQGQLLVLETQSFLPVFPSGVVTDSVQLKTIVAKVRAETGLELRGLHQTSVGKDRPGVDVHRFTAHIASGTLHSFPTAPQVDSDPPVEGFRSASWIAPSLIPKLQGASKDMLELVRDLAWTYTRPA